MNKELFDGCVHVDPCSQTAAVLSGAQGEGTGLPTCKGVLLFTDAADRPVQLLIAANMRRTAVNRLFGMEEATSKKRANLAEVVRKVYYVGCYNDFKSGLKHYQIARALYPDSYGDIVKFARRSYVTIDMSSKWPFFAVVDKVTIGKGKRVFGPFPTRKAAGGFVQILQLGFGLCQKSGLIDDAEKAASCPYLQMGTCAGPCVGNMGREEYLGQINDAVAAGGGDVKTQIEKLQERMRTLARDKAFEEAQMVKKQVQQLELLTKDIYQWTTEVAELRILHIDRSAKIAAGDKRKRIQTYSAFLVRGGEIIELGDFTLDKIEQFYESFLVQLARPMGCMSKGQLNEHLSIVGYYLYRRTPPGVWINCSGGHSPPTAEKILNTICTRFDIQPPDGA